MYYYILLGEIKQLPIDIPSVTVYLCVADLQMSGTKQIGIRIMCVLMLGIFASIFTTIIMCNFAHAVDASGEEHNHPYGHDHHHAGNGPLPEQDHKDKGNDHDHDSGKGCCIDFTFTFLSSLQCDYTPILKLNSKAISVALSLPIFINPLAVKNLFKGMRDFIEPPPKIPDIQVFLQSFQI